MPDQDTAPAEVMRNRRRFARTAVLKRAQMAFGASVIDCLVVDTSLGGVCARTGAVVPVPEWVSLRMPDGSVHPARRRWARGSQIGLELDPDGGALLDAMIAGLTDDQRRALIAKLEASLRRGDG